MDLLLLDACHCNKCIKVISNAAATNENDWILAAILCGTGIITIIAVCVTVYLLKTRLKTQKDKSTKRVLEDILKNDDAITAILKEKIAISNTKEVSQELLSDTDSDFLKKVCNEVHRMNTEEEIKKVLDEMINKKDSEIIKNIKDKVHPNNNPQE